MQAASLIESGEATPRESFDHEASYFLAFLGKRGAVQTDRNRLSVRPAHPGKKHI